MPIIYKILRKTEWDQAQQAGALDGAPVDLADGYIHFSTAGQLAGTAARHFAGEDGLVLLAVQSGRLGPSLVWEPSRGGVPFAHLYARLMLDQIDWVRPVGLSKTGAHIFPPEASA